MANYSSSKNALKNLLEEGTTTNSNSREEETTLQKLKSGGNRSISKKKVTIKENPKYWNLNLTIPNRRLNSWK